MLAISHKGEGGKRQLILPTTVTIAGEENDRPLSYEIRLSPPLACSLETQGEEVSAASDIRCRLNPAQLVWSRNTVSGAITQQLLGGYHRDGDLIVRDTYNVAETLANVIDFVRDAPVRSEWEAPPIGAYDMKMEQVRVKDTPFKDQASDICPGHPEDCTVQRWNIDR